MSPLISIILKPFLYIFIISAISIKVYKTMIRNKWTFFDYIKSRKQQFAIALFLIILSIAYGVYKIYTH